MPSADILVPLDGSALAEEALPIAATLARRRHARLHLVSVQIPFFPLGSGLEVADLTEKAEQAIHEGIRQHLCTVAQRIAASYGVTVTSAVLDGAPAPRLAEYARSNGISLIVMTTHGRSGFSRFWLGSVADQLLRRATVPVLLLRGDERRGLGTFQSVLVALDGAPDTEAVLEPAAAVATPMEGAEWTLLRVVEPPAPIVTPAGVYPAYVAPELLEQQQRDATAYLETVAGRLRARGLRVTTRVLLGGAVAEQIVEFAREQRSDLIAVGTRGAHGMERLLVGSVADKVIRGAGQPVLVVPVRSVRDSSGAPFTGAHAEAVATGARA
ncbi:MAG TPA: universal stress protein [Gemmatimonadales bacterium]|nr:universal stress protein [Gemmatimonadales bacterium]